MGRLKLTAGNALISKKNNKLQILLLSINILISVVIILKLYGII